MLSTVVGKANIKHLAKLLKKRYLICQKISLQICKLYYNSINIFD